MEYSMLSRVDSTRHNWRIKVRVSRMWHLSGTSKGRSFSIVELILVDEEGTSITASIGENEVAKYSLSIVEGHAYFFWNFCVSKERRKYYAVPSTYTIYFTPWTIVEEVPTKSACALPLYVFNFVDFDDLDDRARHPQGLVDIIGKLAVVHPPIQSSTLNGPSVRRNVELHDLSLQGKGSEVILLPSDGDAVTENVDEANANRRSISELLSLNPHDNNVGLIGPILHRFVRV
ncbi:hypothetical protein ABZP36_023771 [Zizania latifolia]